MAEYIKRDDVLKIMKDAWMLHPSGDDAIQEAIDCISCLPAEGVIVRKTGEWVQEYPDSFFRACSICGTRVYSETERDLKKFHAFCGTCGAKMEEEQK